MTLRGLHVQRRLLTLIAVLSQSCSSALADPFTEKLFFKDHVFDDGSSRGVPAGDDVVLECEAAGRPAPTVYWEHDGVRLSPVHCIRSYFYFILRESRTTQNVLWSRASVCK